MKFSLDLHLYLNGMTETLYDINTDTSQQKHGIQYLEIMNSHLPVSLAAFPC